ncbi:MAG: ribonuclease HI [Nonomuraea sp.]|nr:ribonuclease HI [Nonomuraea sp.]
MITLYTDGSAYLADQSGGWAWWVNDSFYDAGHVTPATNNQMEMLAVTRGLNACRNHGEDVLVVSDSAYVINCFRQRWYVGWRSRTDLMGAWRASTGKRVANQELWEELIGIVENYPTRISWRHCRGHGRGGEEDAPYVYGNDKVDRLAGAARKARVEGRPYPPADKGAATMAGALFTLKRSKKR